MTTDRLFFVAAVIIMAAGFLTRFLSDASGTPLIVIGIVLGVVGLIVKSRGPRS